MDNSIEKTALNIGKTMIENGAEISRCEDTIIRILKHNKCSNINVFCISSLIIIKTDNTCEIGRIKKNDLDLFIIDEMNALSRSICTNTSFKNRVNNYSIMSNVLLTFLATSSFCLYFGGNIYDAISAGIIGIIMDNLRIKINVPFAKTLFYSVIGGFLSFVPYLIFDGLHYGKIMIGTIMLLIPGLTISNGMRDIMTADILSGIIELTQAVFLAIAIAIGYGLSILEDLVYF